MRQLTVITHSCHSFQFSTLPMRQLTKTQLDLTPVIKEMASERYKRNWEVGAGVGYNKERHSVYYPIAVQRNFSYDRAIEAIVGVDKHGVQNVSVVYKVKF